MKKKLLAMLIAVLVLMLASCGKKDEAVSENVSETASQSSETVEEVQKTAESGETPTAETTESEAAKVESDTQMADGIVWKYMDLEDGTISIYQYETEQVPETVEVPSEVDGKTVTEIESLFKNEEVVKKVVLPSSLKIIGPEAFMSSISVEEVVISSVIESIEGKAFYGCSGIKSLSFPEGLKKIAKTGIYQNTGLEEIHMPASVEMTTDDLNYSVWLLEETTLYAPAGSVWEELANEIGYKFAAE